MTDFADDRTVLDRADDVIADAGVHPGAERRSRPASDWPFRRSAKGVEKRIDSKDKETGVTVSEWRWFCSVLDVEADTRNADGEEWGRLLRVVDRDGCAKRWAMPMAMMAGDGTAYREALLSRGLVLAPGRFARDALHEFIGTAPTKRPVRCVSHVGWADDAFVLPHLTVGDPATTIFQSDNAADNPYSTGGTLKGWRDGVARYAAGNSRLVVALSAAFAGPLLLPTDAEGGGFHFRGPSSAGKTTALAAAASVWGGTDFVRTWRATANGLESVAALHSDTLLCLDELGQVDGREVGQVAYMLANGQGKARASRSGGARRSTRWRTVFLSTGEIGLADKMSEDGRARRPAAGQEVRIVDIPADAGAGMGMLEQLHGFDAPGALARHLKEAAARHHGHAAIDFLRHLTSNRDRAMLSVAKFRQCFITENAPAGADGQVMRVADRFALVAAAGELAIRFNVLPWDKGEALRGAARCFADWLVARGGIEPGEVRDALRAVRSFIELHATSRFQRLSDENDTFGDPSEQRIVNRAGFRRPCDGGMEYLFTSEVWRTEVCNGLDAAFVAKTLAARGFLRQGPDGKNSINVRLPGVAGTVRVYAVNSSILATN